MAGPLVYSAITAVTAELAKEGVPKNRRNQLEGYQYRSIDDVLDRLSGLLSRHRLCILPKVVSREMMVDEGSSGEGGRRVVLKVAYVLVSTKDGSSHTVQVYGEAIDFSDRATAKATTAAYKSAMIQTFCIPAHGIEDPDAESPRLQSRSHLPEPVQGWRDWVRDLEDIVGVCESEDAVNLVQSRNRRLLNALSREQPDLYAAIGRSFATRRIFVRDKPALGDQKFESCTQPSEVVHAVNQALDA